ncbi:MAG: hypothetical protein JSR64_15390 [Nitrospira sp.]|nr:hypothetical protein [Nitrospira sp.]
MLHPTEITHDGIIEIATGRNRKETNWRNRETSWSELVRKLSATHRTAETYTEYITSKKARQDEIKDVGGFVGGYLTSGRRKASSVLHRQLITLDLDYCSAEFWEDLTLVYGNAAVVYSTHKHSPDNPRMRLVMPLDRPVRPDEYEAISRRIAGVLGIELFDPTTFQPERLMYWPSTAKEAVYEYHVQDGPWLVADDLLATYRDWRDSSEWPVSERVDKLVQRSMQKQGDPLEKPGVIGAFCRTYTIHEAIELFLDDVYESCSIEGRYSYKEGSTAAGLVTYDDKYAYSHHGTDPTSGKLCNAFDLVRIHKFGLKDEDAREGTPGNKLPSYVAMTDFAGRDPKVRKLIVAERLDSARSDFEVEEVEIEEVEAYDDSWREKLEVDRKGNIFGTIDNITLILENDPYFRGRIAYDDFEKCEVAIRDLPWRKVSWQTRRLLDRDDANIRHYLEKAYGISHLTKTKDAMQVWAQKTVFHPVKDYLNGLTWDGEPRVDTLLVDYQGAEDSEYTRMVTRKILVAAVARVFRPGCKFDTILTLVGKQGLKKSSLIAKLGRQWFSDSFSFNQLTKNETKACEQVQGVWLIEIAEMSGMAKAEIETVKHFVSKTEDRFRVAYGHRTENFPRQCVFFATTNKTDFLRDPTGNRRYWPVQVMEQEPVKDVFKDLTEGEIDQVWAEAVEYFKKGEKLYLPEDMVETATEVQRMHTEEHPWVSIIQEYLDIKLPENWSQMDRDERMFYIREEDGLNERGVQYRTRVCIHEIWAEALGKRELIDERSAATIRNAMATIEGWKEEKNMLRYGIYGRQRRGYFRVGVPDIELSQRHTGGVTALD